MAAEGGRRAVVAIYVLDPHTILPATDARTSQDTGEGRTCEARCHVARWTAAELAAGRPYAVPTHGQVPLGPAQRGAATSEADAREHSTLAARSAKKGSVSIARVPQCSRGLGTRGQG